MTFIQFVCFIFNSFGCDTMDSANLLLKLNQSRSKTGISISNPPANQAIKSGSNTLNNGHSFPPLNPLDFQAWLNMGDESFTTITIRYLSMPLQLKYYWSSVDDARMIKLIFFLFFFGDLPIKRKMHVTKAGRYDYFCRKCSKIT